MAEVKAKVGGVVQLAEGHRWAGCFAIIEEIRAWGVVAYIPFPKGEATATAPIRLDTKDFEVVAAVAPLTWEDRD